MPKYKQGCSCDTLIEEGIYPEDYDIYDEVEIDEDYNEYLQDMESDYGYLEDLEDIEEYF